MVANQGFVLAGESTLFPLHWGNLFYLTQYLVVGGFVVGLLAGSEGRIGAQHLVGMEVGEGPYPDGHFIKLYFV